MSDNGSVWKLNKNDKNDYHTCNVGFSRFTFQEWVKFLMLRKRI